MNLIYLPQSDISSGLKKGNYLKVRTACIIFSFCYCICHYLQIGCFSVFIHQFSTKGVFIIDECAAQIKMARR